MSNTELLSSEATNASSAGQQESEANGTPRRRGGLSGMVLAELRQLAGELGIETGGLRKGDLIAAIKEKQGGTTAPRTRSTKKSMARAEEVPAAKAHQPALDETEAAPRETPAESGSGTNGAPTRGRTRRPHAAESAGEDDNRRGTRRRRSPGRVGAAAESGGADEQRGAERKSEGRDSRQERENRQERDSR
ncbi:Rho termination factor N-terminal domain-containing protein, partial [Saccharopolyspora sp. NPDC000995]